MGKVKQIEKIYYDPRNPAAYTSGKGLYKQLGKKIKGKRIAQWLGQQETWGLHKPIRYKFRRRKTVSPWPHRYYQVDLLDTSKYSPSNKGVKFILTAIDVFSKFAWAVPIKNKTGVAVTEALKKVLSKKKYHELAIQSDKGKEFTNKQVQQFLKSKNIRFFTTENDDIKASLVERFNRTLQSKIHRYMTHKKTEAYLGVLPELLAGYNDTVHSTTGFSPTYLSSTTDESVHLAVWDISGFGEPPWDRVTRTFKVGDHVRINKTRVTFRKSYIAGWSRELFRIVGINETYPRTYRIVDQGGEEVRGNFYPQELLAAPDPEFHDVEKIVKKRKKGKSVQYLVKWAGYSDKYNSWVEEKNLSQFK